MLPFPLTLPQAVQRIDRWLGVEQVSVLREAPEHWRGLRSVVVSADANGNLVNDAHMATLAMSHDATLVSCDTDFARFEGLRWENPLAGTVSRPRRSRR